MEMVDGMKDKNRVRIKKKQSKRNERNPKTHSVREMKQLIGWPQPNK